MSRASLEERQRFPRQPRATPTPSREPRPASAQISMGVMGVCRLDPAIGEASAKPTLPPTNAARRSAPGSQRSLEAIKTAAPTPASPPMTAPANNPGFPAPLPRMDPTTAPSPARTQAAMNRGSVFKRKRVSLRLRVIPHGPLGIPGLRLVPHTLAPCVQRIVDHEPMTELLMVVRKVARKSERDRQ